MTCMALKWHISHMSLHRASSSKIVKKKYSKWSEKYWNAIKSVCGVSYIPFMSLQHISLFGHESKITCVTADFQHHGARQNGESFAGLMVSRMKMLSFAWYHISYILITKLCYSGNIWPPQYIHVYFSPFSAKRPDPSEQLKPVKCHRINVTRMKVIDII